MAFSQFNDIFQNYDIVVRCIDLTGNLYDFSRWIEPDCVPVAEKQKKLKGFTCTIEMVVLASRKIDEEASESMRCSSECHRGRPGGD